MKSRHAGMGVTNAEFDALIGACGQDSEQLQGRRA